MMRVAIVLLLFLTVTGCEKDINISLKDTEPKLVIEATIENGGYPNVVLSRSVGYFSGLSPEVLAQSFVHNADVFVSDGTRTHKLKEYQISFAPTLSLYYYSVDSASLTTAFKGAYNQTYSLRVVADGKEYAANTTIPALRKRIDTMYARPAPAPDTAKRNVLVRVTDPPGFGDYVRAFTKINSGPFLPPFNSTFDDLFIDGTTYEVQMVRGVDRNLKDEVKEYTSFNKGDTVTLKLSQVDKATFDFWKTMEYSYSSVGNPFSTPTKVTSNISNGALGYFGGYASVYRSIIIPR